MEQPADGTPGDEEPAVNVGAPTIPDIGVGAPADSEGDPSADPTDPAVGPGSPDAVAGDDAADADEESDDPPEPATLALFLRGEDVLLRYDPANGIWRRLGPRSEIIEGDRLLSLPAFKPNIMLEAGFSVDLVDGSLVDVAVSPSGLPALSLTYGQILVTNTAADDAELRFSVGEVTGTLTLGPAASVAVEVDRPFQPGLDPRVASSPLIAVCHAPVGDASWSGAGFEVTALDDGGVWRVAGDSVSPVEPLTELPEWVIGRKLNPLDREAAPVVEAAIKVGEPAWPRLSELNQSRLREARALSIICSLHVGHFEDFVKALSDEDQKLSWAAEIEALRGAMSRSQALAASLYAELVNQRGEDRAEELFEMLVGYDAAAVGQTPDEWRVGAMRKLIGWLESDQRDYRVLANYNLEQITGRADSFDPNGTPRSREQTVSRLRARLENARLTPKAF